MDNSLSGTSLPGAPLSGSVGGAPLVESARATTRPTTVGVHNEGVHGGAEAPATPQKAGKGTPVRAALPRVAFAGNPNTGKTSLFNRLTGSNARVGNYPGVTVEREIGKWRLPGGDIEVIDVPGTYSLAARSSDEQVAVRALFGLDGDVRPHLAVVVLDATQLARNLYFAVQLLEAGVPMVLALNLIDAAREEGVEPDVEKLRRALGVPVVPVSARTGEGMEELGAAVRRVLETPEEGRAPVGWRYPAALEADVAKLVPLVNAQSPEEARALSLWALLSVDESDDLMDVPDMVRQKVLALRAAAASAGRDLDAEIVGARYRWLDAQALTVPRREGLTLTDRIDKVVLSPLTGGLLFLLVMGVLFQALFAWSDPAITAIEAGFGLLGEGLRAVLAPGLLADFLVDGVIGGVGSVLVFLPQILLLFFLIGLLEDSGYMARVAYLVDRMMRSLGLHGRAFVPMLSGYACAVPAIMATRTLESRRDRLLTMMVVPLMSCSARLPVYTLVVAALFPAGSWLGFIPVRAGMMVFMYLFSTGMALLAAGVLGKTLLRGKRMPLLLELPSYRLPRLSTVLRQMVIRAKMFVTEAGTVILGCTVVLWALLTFPRVDPSELAAAGAVHAPVEVTADEAATEQAASEQAEHEIAQAQLENSYGGRLGHAIEPLIAPLGFDWRIGIGMVGAFAAREVFVSTMGLVYGMGGDVDEENVPLRERIGGEKKADGTPRYTPLTGLSLMVFFALSAQCMSTIAVVKRESRSWGWASFLFVYMTVLAWVASFLVYQGGRWLGFP